MKGEGASLMVADFVSADYGWLTSTDNSSSTQILFKAGKQHEEYFTNSDILAHVSTAIDILDKDYANKEHVLIFNNATTHLKHKEDALSATKMPKFTPAIEKNWGVEVDEVDEDCNVACGINSKVLKMCVNMVNAKIADGCPLA